MVPLTILKVDKEKNTTNLLKDKKKKWQLK